MLTFVFRDELLERVDSLMMGGVGTVREMPMRGGPGRFRWSRGVFTTQQSPLAKIASSRSRAKMGTPIQSARPEPFSGRSARLAPASSISSSSLRRPEEATPIVESKLPAIAAE
jgi:hypothetical protein